MAEEKYNEDELVPPSFLNEAFIVDALKKVENDPELHVINYSINPGSSAGDHYASVMFKITATYGSQGRIVVDRRFILKTIPDVDGPKKDLLEQMPAFKNEIIMYTVTLPAMEKILRGHGEEPYWPTLVYSQRKPFVLMFDDLTVDKYQVIYDPLDFEQLKLITDKIAKFHALSLVLLQNGHTQVTQYEAGINSAMKGIFTSIGQHLINVAAEVKTWPGYEVIGEKLQRAGPELASKFLSADHVQNERFFVMNHGDFHLRNLMFKKNSEGGLEKCLFLDFQMPVFYTPVQDLIGLINTMGNMEVRQRRDEVLKLYHGILVDSLKQYGYTGKTPSVVDIQIELLRNIDYYAFSSLLALPMFSIKGVDLAELFNTAPDSPSVIGMKQAFKDPKIVEDMKPLLTYFNNMGIFD